MDGEEHLESCVGEGAEPIKLLFQILWAIESDVGVTDGWINSATLLSIVH